MGSGPGHGPANLSRRHPAKPRLASHVLDRMGPPPAPESLLTESERRPGQEKGGGWDHQVDRLLGIHDRDEDEDRPGHRHLLQETCWPGNLAFPRSQPRTPPSRRDIQQDLL